MAKTDWQMGDIVQPADMNQIGQEINQNRDDLAAHTAATTGVHGATSAATPNTIIQRDANGRAKVAAPVFGDDIAQKATVDAAIATYGLGTAVLIPSGTDWNTINKTGFYRTSGTTQNNAPTDTHDHDLIHIQAPNGEATQISFAAATRAFFRVKDDGTTWGPWQEFATKNDYVRTPGYATASGSANAYSVTLNPAPSAYVDGMGVTVKINVDNTGPATINVNGLGAKAIKRANGLDVAAGMLKAGSIVTLRYNTTTGNFILQGEGSDVIPLYIAGVEYVPWVVGYSKGGSASKQTDHFKIVVTTSQERAFVTDTPVDLTKINRIWFEAKELSSTYGYSELVVSTEKMENRNVYNAKVGIGSSTNYLDVSSLTGSYYIRIHRDMFTAGGTSDFRIYRVILSP